MAPYIRKNNCGIGLLFFLAHPFCAFAEMIHLGLYLLISESAFIDIEVSFHIHFFEKAGRTWRELNIRLHADLIGHSRRSVVSE